MAGGGKMPSNAGKIRQSERNRTNDDAAFKRADQKISAQNAEREQKRRAFVLQRPADYVGSRAHEREENPEAFSAQGSSSDLAGLDGHSAISETQASMAGYNERRQRTQAAKAEKLAEDKRRDFEIKLDQAQYEIANMQPRAQASRSRQNMSGEKVQNESQIPIRQSQQVLPQEATLNRPRTQTGQNRQTEPGLPEQTIDLSMPSNYVVGIPTSGQAAKGNTIPNSLSDVEFSVPVQQGDEVVRTPGQATILVQTPNRNEGVKVTERDPGLREDALIVEQPHNQPQVNLSQTISKNASQTAPESTAAVEAASKNDY